MLDCLCLYVLYHWSKFHQNPLGKFLPNIGFVYRPWWKMTLLQLLWPANTWPYRAKIYIKLHLDKCIFHCEMITWALSCYKEWIWENSLYCLKQNSLRSTLNRPGNKAEEYLDCRRKHAVLKIFWGRHPPPQWEGVWPCLTLSPTNAFGVTSSALPTHFKFPNGWTLPSQVLDPPLQRPHE